MIQKQVAEISGVQIPEIGFGSKIQCRDQGGKAALVVVNDVQEKDFTAYDSVVTAAGFSLRESRSFGKNQFFFRSDGENTLILSYFPGIREMHLVVEPNVDYLNFCDVPGNSVKKSAFTQIDLEDYGLCDVIDLEDGRFVVIDGGREFEKEADKLFSYLQTNSAQEKPVIAAWIMTHPHLDHYPGFLSFWKKYREQVEIQRFLYNFPDAELNEENFSYMSYEQEDMKRFFQAVEETKAPVIRVHTGQEITIGNLRMEILSSPDDLIFGEDAGINMMSLVMKTYIAGQILLLCSDSNFDYTPVMRQYGDYLKADILQMPHHAFGGGTVEQFRQIDPEVCFAPVSEIHFYRYFCYYFAFNRYLMHELHVKELFTGKDGQDDVTLPLPYTPRPEGRERMLALEAMHQKALGAKTWVFLNLTLEECKFTALNMGYLPVDVYIDLYFAERKDTVKSIKLTVDKEIFLPVDLADRSQFDGDAVYYNPRALDKKGIPEGTTFSVCFRCDFPLVIQGPKAADYHD